MRSSSTVVDGSRIRGTKGEAMRAKKDSRGILDDLLNGALAWAIAAMLAAVIFALVIQGEIIL